MFIDTEVRPSLAGAGPTLDRAVTRAGDAPAAVPVLRTPRGKRAFDVAFALTALILLSPLLLMLAVVTGLVLGFPVIFRQRRMTAGGRTFMLYKFRSLPRSDDAQQAGRWGVAANRRPGPWGDFLRRSSLDELPQLVNVLKGDMSLVGPRPERPEFVAEFTTTIPGYGQRHRVVSGLTGWAQVKGLRGTTCLTTRAAYDNDYIDRRSMLFDAVIILRTFTAVMHASAQ